MMRLLLLAIFLFGSSLHADSREMYQLKEKVLALSKENNKILATNEVIANNRLARYQAKLLIKTLSYEIHLYLKRQGVNRSVSKIEKIVEASYLSSWIFVDLGKDHLDRFVTINQWAREETGFDPQLISRWKAGTYLKSLKKKVLRDTVDYGAFQVNEGHIESLKLINFLYDSSVINFKVRRVRSVKDLMDVNTNCVARCIIETDRKARGWEWQHMRDRQFRAFMISTIDKLSKEHLYNRHFVEKYYSLTPIRAYSAKDFNF
jgi:hypothetical protein